MPWVMIVDSSATIGFLAGRASATSGEKSIRSAALIAYNLHRRRPRSAAPGFIGNLNLMINGANWRRNSAAPWTTCDSADSRYPRAERAGKIRVDGRLASAHPGPAGSRLLDPACAGRL